MASLTQIAITTRRVIRYGFFLIIFLIIGKFALDIAIKTYRKIRPAPPPPPTLSFGKLPKLPFPGGDDKKTEKYNFTLETPDGNFPKLSPQAKVYFMPKPASTLLSLDLAKEKAKLLGFEENAEEISETLYRFKHKETEARLEINIVTGSFSISYDLKADSSPLQKRPPAAEVAAANVRAYLSSASLLPADLTGPTTHQFLKPEGGTLVPGLAISDSNIVKIDFFRKSFDDFPSVTQDPKQANIWFYVSGESQKGKQMVAAEYHYLSVDESQFGTYPLKTSDIAWEELKNGQAFLASPGTNKEEDEIRIRKIYLAYFDPGSPTEFFQPIVVFEGDRDFVAYAPAVTSDYYGE